MTIDEFFGSNIVQNMATFLDVSPSQIRVANAVFATSKRRRRRSSNSGNNTMEIVIEIGDPAPTSGTSASTPTLNFDDLDKVYKKIVDITAEVTSICDQLSILFKHEHYSFWTDGGVQKPKLIFFLCSCILKYIP